MGLCNKLEHQMKRFEPQARKATVADHCGMLRSLEENDGRLAGNTNLDTKVATFKQIWVVSSHDVDVNHC